jgi:predicted Zn-dependent protease
MDVAELIAELESPTAPGGRNAQGELVAAADLLVEARLRHAPREDIHAGMARILLIRSRARRFQHWREGLVAAARFANEAIVGQPGHVPSRVLLAAVQVGLGRLDAARHGLVALMSENPDDAEILRVRSRWLRAHGDVVAAADAVQRILPRLDEGKARIERLRLARMLIEMRRAREAEAPVRHLVTEFPERGELWFLLAEALLDAGKAKEAADAARRAIELHPTREARELYGRAVGRGKA